MSRLPLALRLFWAAWLGLLAASVMVPTLGPALEARLFPVWNDLHFVEGGRGEHFVHFSIAGRKMRLTPSPGVDVTMIVPTDLFDLTLYVDKSVAPEPPCTHRIPWSHGQAVAAGPHTLRFCVELPENVPPDQPITIRSTPRYRGWLGLWELRVPFPTIKDEMR